MCVSPKSVLISFCLDKWANIVEMSPRRQIVPLLKLGYFNSLDVHSFNLTNRRDQLYFGTVFINR